MILSIACFVASGLATSQDPSSSDWPQYMRVSEHTGDAATEELKLPLGLVARVALEDAVLSSPAVIGDRAYIVDQLGTAYAVEWKTGRVLWKANPDAERAMGSNTSSPCVVKGRVYFGTTAGTFHVLDAASGRVIKTMSLEGGITGSPTHANDSIYFQTLGAVLHCIDLDGNERWKWDHYARYIEPKPERFKGYHPGGYAPPHYGGGEVAVSGKRVVTSFGWDHVCVEDKGTEAALAWCNRAALGKDDGIPMFSSISEGAVYTGWPGVDGAGTLLRVSLADGSFDPKKDQLGRDRWAILGTPAARGKLVVFGRTIRGVTAYEYEKGTRWESFHWAKQAQFTPVLGSPALSKDHAVFATAGGELIVVDLAAQGSAMDKLKPAPFAYRTPDGKFISSSPAVSQGHVFFGCDDGHLYVLGPGGTLVSKGAAAIAARKSRVRPATGTRYAWPSPYGGPANTNLVNDPGLKAPLRLRWAIRSFGAFVAPLSATEEDLVGVTMEGTVLCLEQETARLRWRRRLPPQDPHGTTGALCHEDRVYTVRQQGKDRGLLYCLSIETGETLWTAPVGSTQWYARAAPICAGGIVAFGHLKGDPAKSVVEAWDARTGKRAWEVALEAAQHESHGCLIDGKLIYSGGSRKEPEGETVAIDPADGKVLWRTRDAHCGYRGTPSGRDGKVYLTGWGIPISCVSAEDGKVLWKSEQKHYWGHAPALGPDFLTGRGYSGDARGVRLEDGKSKTLDGKSLPIGAPDHACGPVLLTSGGLSIAVSVSGLYLRDFATGKLLWNSPGFAPRSCSNPIAANGRIFFNPQMNGMLYCFEPEEKK